MKESGSDVDNKLDIAHTINAYFCSVGKELAIKIEAVPSPLATWKHNLNPHNMQFIFKAIGVQDIREAMLAFKTSKSFGSDTISSYFYNSSSLISITEGSTTMFGGGGLGGLIL